MLTLTASPPSLSMNHSSDRNKVDDSADLWNDFRARMSMVDGFPYKEEVGGSSPSAPTMTDVRGRKSDVSLEHVSALLFLTSDI
jgi:hypothetical protein